MSSRLFGNIRSANLHIFSIWRTDRGLQRRFVRYLSFAHNGTASRSSPQDILTLFGTHSMSPLAQSPDFNLPSSEMLKRLSRRYTLTDFDTQTLATSVTRPRRELHQHSYKSFFQVDYCRSFANISQYDTKRQ
jgi:hypothetical protein